MDTPFPAAAGDAGQLILVSDCLKRLPAPPIDRNLPVALRSLATWLNRAPRVDDLVAPLLFDWGATLLDRGISRETVDRYWYSIGRLARMAVAAGVLEEVPRLPRLRERWTVAKTQPWTVDALTTLFGAVRTLRGLVAGVPAAAWWKALVLTSLDLQQPAAPLLALPGPAFNLSDGMLTIGLYVYTLHPRTVAAIAELGTGGAPRLFPWELDESASAGGNPYYMLFLDFKKILKRANLPRGKLNLFRRLQFTGEADPEIIDKIDWDRPFALPHGADESPAALQVTMKPRRRRGNPRWAAAGDISLGVHSKKAKPKEGPDVYLIDNPSDRTLCNFLDTVYIPRRLAYGSPRTAVAYRATLNRLREFCLTDCTLDALSDDLIEEFLAWWRPRRAPDSLKRMRGDLLVIWRYAWRKRRVETQPRDVDEIRTPKRLPECWSVEELDRLLTVAGAVEGTVCGIPASLYWPALLMTAIETGLRKNALMSLEVKHFAPDRGWVRALAETQKQKADQDLPISEQTVRLILATCPANREKLFPWPFIDARKTLDTRLRALLRQAGLPCGRRDLWHKFRRTCATFTADIAGDVEAQKLLGHASVSTTRNYIQVSKLRRARVVDHPELQRPAWKPRALLGEDPR